MQILDREFVLDIPDNVSTIGIMVSGGLDSAVLLYLLAKEIHDTDSFVKLHVFCVPRPTDGSDCHTLAIIEYINVHIGNVISSYTVRGEVDMHHSSIVHLAYMDILDSGIVDCIFLGDTDNPDSDLPGVCPTSWPNRLEDRRPMIHQPFLTYSKKYIVALCVLYDLQELAKLTHSCTVHKHKRCNECFQCQERIWAFNCNNLKDTGTI